MTDQLQNTDVVEQLKAIEQELVRAWVAGDPSVHERVLADDWRVIDAQGRIMDKKQVLEEMFSSPREISGSIDDFEVRPYGDWAIVTGRTHVSGRYEGKDIEVTLRFTDVFRKVNNGWQVLASQATMLNS